MVNNFNPLLQHRCMVYEAVVPSHFEGQLIHPRVGDGLLLWFIAGDSYPSSDRPPVMMATMMVSILLPSTLLFQPTINKWVKFIPNFMTVKTMSDHYSYIFILVIPALQCRRRYKCSTSKPEMFTSKYNFKYSIVAIVILSACMT